MCHDVRAIKHTFSTLTGLKMPLRPLLIILAAVAVLGVSSGTLPAAAGCRDFWNSAESFDDIAQAYWEQERWDKGSTAYLTAVFFWERAGLACQGEVAARAVNNANHARYRTRLADCKEAFGRARRLFDTGIIMAKTGKRSKGAQTFVEAAEAFAEAAQVCGGANGERAGINASLARKNERAAVGGGTPQPPQHMAPEDPKMVRLPWDQEVAKATDPLDAPGQKALKLGALDGALKPQMDDLVGDNPQKRAAQVLIKRGEAWLDIGRWQRALNEFAQAAELDPKMPGARLGLAQAHHHLGQAQAGLEELKRFVELAPKDPRGASLQKKLEERLARHDFTPSPPPALGRPRQPEKVWVSMGWLPMLTTAAGWRALALYCLAPWVVAAALIMAGVVRRWWRVLLLAFGMSWLWYLISFSWRGVFLGPDGPSAGELSQAAMIILPLGVILIRAPWSRGPISIANRDLHMGREALLGGHYDAAIKHLTRVVERGKEEDVREALRDRIIAHAKRNQLQEAVADCQKFIELAPMNPVGPRLLQLLQDKLAASQARSAAQAKIAQQNGQDSPPSPGHESEASSETEKT